MDIATASNSSVDYTSDDAVEIAPASLLARIMLLGAGIGLILAAFVLLNFVLSGDKYFLVGLLAVLGFAGMCLAGWRLARNGKVSIAARLLLYSTSVLALIGILLDYTVLPLSLTLITCGVLLSMPYSSSKAFRENLFLGGMVFVLVGFCYLFNEPAKTLYGFSARLSIFVGCMLIVLLMSYLLYRSSVWMHVTVLDLRNTNAALQQVQAGLEDTIEHRTAELIQSNKQLASEVDERRHVEAQLRAQNDLLETLHDTSLDIVDHLEMHELLQSILAKACSLLGIQDAFLDLIVDTSRKTLSIAATGVFDDTASYEFSKGEGLVGTVWESGKTVVVEDYQTWERGSPFAVARNIRAAIGVPLIVGGKVFGVIGMVRMSPGQIFTLQEVTLLERFAGLASIACDNAQLYETVRASEQALEARVEARTRELTAALQENDLLRAQAVRAAMAEERSRLARDLHDSVSQAIYGIVLGTRTLQQLMLAGPENVTASQQLQKVVDYILSLADAALTEMRALIFELRPESLQQEGLLTAFRKQCDVLQVRYGLMIDLQAGDREPELSIEAKEAFYRIAIEATHNIVKHAGARQIALYFQPIDGAYRMRIIDDGSGFDPDRVSAGRLGLHTMRERAEKLGGNLQLITAPGKGTEIQVEIPLVAGQPVQAGETPPQAKIQRKSDNASQHSTTANKLTNQT